MATRAELNKAWEALYTAQQEMLKTIPPDSAQTTPYDEFVQQMLRTSPKNFVEKVVIACGYRLTREDFE